MNLVLPEFVHFCSVQNTTSGWILFLHLHFYLGGMPPDLVSAGLRMDSGLQLPMPLPAPLHYHVLHLRLPWVYLLH